MDVSPLEGLGVSHAEAQLYVALLTQGPSTTGTLIALTKMQSSTVYHTLGTLLEKGVISYILRGKVKYFHAEKPEIFITFWEERKRKFDEILPLLKQKEKKGIETRSAKMYEGMKGLRAAYDDVLHTMKRGELYYFVQVPKEKLSEKQYKLFYRNYHTLRSEKGINVRGLSYFGTEGAIKDVFAGLPHTEIRYTHEIGPTSLVIYANKVMTIDVTDEPVVFVMESFGVANSYRRFFEDKWKRASKPLRGV
ncbi:MAG: hypothetical protein HY393_04520 [Candidatus Diapherotrites archaeon]|nr:hypothetical protein [Candidatus Diapherotrites archaeon]